MQRRHFPDLAKKEAAAIFADLAKLEADPALLAALQRRAFIEKGLDLVDGPECPLCDTPWKDEQHLRDHLKAKLAKSEEARKLQQSLLNNGAAIARKPYECWVSWRRSRSLRKAQGDAPIHHGSDALEGRSGSAESQARRPWTGSRA